MTAAEAELVTAGERPGEAGFFSEKRTRGKFFNSSSVGFSEPLLLPVNSVTERVCVIEFSANIHPFTTAMERL